MKEDDVKVEMKTGSTEGKGGKEGGSRAKEDEEERKMKERNPQRKEESMSHVSCLHRWSGLFIHTTS